MIVGLTGGIGAGKSTVARAFEALGVDWVDADDVAREIVAPGETALRLIGEHFGPAVIQADGRLDRAALRERIFNAPEERRWLEQLTHPRVRARLIEHLEDFFVQQPPYVLLVSPLLFESGQDALVSVSVVVDVPEAVQRARTLARDGVSEAQVRAILAAQMPRETRCLRADYLIDNSGSEAAMKRQVAELDQHLRERAASEDQAASSQPD